MSKNKIYRDFSINDFIGKKDETMYIRPSLLYKLNGLSFESTLLFYNENLKYRNLTFEIVDNRFSNVEDYLKAKRHGIDTKRIYL